MTDTKNSSDNNSSAKKPTPSTKEPKAKGPIRTEAVVPFLIVALVTWAYFHFLFDRNLKSLFELVGYQVVGAQVDVADLETSFWKASFRAQGIELTNSEKPELNAVKIGDIRYSVLWDGLLRARFIVNEMAVEQIEFNVPRKSKGKVKPPEPPKPKSTEPSKLEQEASKIKDKVLDKAQEEYSGNVFGDIATMLSGGGSGQDQVTNIENSLPSKAKLKEFEKDFNAKQAKWNEKMKTLPQGKEIQAIGDKLGKVKTKDFKSPQELQESLQQIDGILKEADAKVKLVQATSTEFNQDIKAIDSGYKEMDALVKKDIKDLESRFKIPKIDAKSLSRGIFMQYLGPYMAMFHKYQGIAEKYVPPNIMKKAKGGGAKSEADEIAIKPHPRASGVTYEFGRPNSYPLFWIKRVSISSQAGASKQAGNIKGLVTDITSNQKLTGKPTVATIEGGFPGLEIQALLAKLTLDTRKEDSRLDYDFSIGSYGILGRDLVNSPDVNIAFKQATGQLKSKGSLVGLTDFQFNLNNDFQKIDYEIKAKNEIVDSVLKDVFKGIPVVTLEASGHGELPGLTLNIESNLGPELSKGFEKQLQRKIEEARQKLQAAIDAAIGKEKAKLESDINKLKSQYEGELKKVTDQINSQKTKAQAKVDQSKKDSENQGKKKIEQEGKKALDQLKDKLGF
jgi:uncharacterized protein (TIGR03545 family)